MDIRAGARVIGEVPTGVIGICIKNYLILIPRPVGHIVGLPRRDEKITAAHREAMAHGIEAMRAKMVARPKSTFKASRRKIQAKAHIARARVVTKPTPAIDTRPVTPMLASLASLTTPMLASLTI